MYQSFKLQLPKDYVNNNPKILSRVVEDLESGKEFHYLFIGTVGAGKTMLAQEIMNQIRKNNFDLKCVELKAREIYQDYLAALGSKFSDKSTQLKKRMQCLRWDVSFLDDLGAEKPRTESSRAYMEYLLEDRYDWIKKHKCCTIITTNLTGKEIGDLYGHRVLSRFHEVFTIMKFNECDFRQVHTDIIEG